MILNLEKINNPEKCIKRTFWKNKKEFKIPIHPDNEAR